VRVVGWARHLPVGDPSTGANAAVLIAPLDSGDPSSRIALCVVATCSIPAGARIVVQPGPFLRFHSGEASFVRWSRCLEELLGNGTPLVQPGAQRALRDTPPSLIVATPNFRPRGEEPLCLKQKYDRWDKTEYLVDGARQGRQPDEPPRWRVFGQEVAGDLDFPVCADKGDANCELIFCDGGFFVVTRRVVPAGDRFFVVRRKKRWRPEDLRAVAPPAAPMPTAHVYQEVSETDRRLLGLVCPDGAPAGALLDILLHGAATPRGWAGLRGVVRFIPAHTLPNAAVVHTRKFWGVTLLRTTGALQRGEEVLVAYTLERRGAGAETEEKGDRQMDARSEETAPRGGRVEERGT
jgi:hypothetical protein